MAMADAKGEKTAPRIYLTKQKTQQAWLKICNDERKKLNLSLYTDQKKFVYACGLALKKENVSGADWKRYCNELRKDPSGEKQFMKICMEANLHVSGSTENKRKIVRKVVALFAAAPPPKAKVPPPSAPQVGSAQKVQLSRLHKHRSAQKHMLIPYVLSLYHFGVLKQEEHPAATLLRDDVLDLMAANCHKQWTRQVNSLFSLLAKFKNSLIFPLEKLTTCALNAPRKNSLALFALSHF